MLPMKDMLETTPARIRAIVRTADASRAGVPQRPDPTIKGGRPLVDPNSTTTYVFIEVSTAQDSAPPMGRFIDPSLEREFKSLVEQWRRETMSISSLSDMVLHPAYYQIIGMGRDILPLLLRELKERGGHWFLALRAISRQNPIRKEDRGKVKKMVQAWLKWGKENGLLDSEDGCTSVDTNRVP